MGDDVRVVIVAPGSTGDVAPFTGLGRRLVEDGYQVTVAAYERFAALVTGAGLGFHALSGDPERMGSSGAGRRWQRAGTGPRATVHLVQMFATGMHALGRDVLAAAAGADMLLLNAMGLFPGWHVAEALEIPSAGVFMAPAQRTGAFPPVGLGLPSLGDRLNRALWRAGLDLSTLAFTAMVRSLRAELGLPRMRSWEMWRRLDACDWPVLHGFSESVVARPADWRPGIEVTGYWWPAPRPTWSPPAELSRFLDDGPPPVYIGLGSRTFDDPDRIGRRVADAARRAGVRAVVQAGWADLDVRDDDVVTVGEVPHDWLFPRMAAVAHHCGAGTTAAGLRAGVPTIGLPLVTDQPFWAGRLVDLGVSPMAMDVRRMDVERLACGLRAAIDDPRYRVRAGALGRIVRSEDGAGQVSARVERLLRRA